jgi:hypothetical protein
VVAGSEAAEAVEAGAAVSFAAMAPAGVLALGLGAVAAEESPFGFRRTTTKRTTISAPKPISANIILLLLLVGAAALP